MLTFSVMPRDGKHVIETRHGGVLRDATPEEVALMDEVMALRRWRCDADCRFTMGNVADVSGVYCDFDDPCMRCQLDHATEARDRYREALEQIAKEAVKVLVETPQGKDPVLLAPWVAGTANDALRG